MHGLPRLDLMIAYSCNLSCRGCISLSDRTREGIAPYSDIQTWLQTWQLKIEPNLVTIFGGEPLLHPKIVDICRDVRSTWPAATIRVITNGYLLDRVDPAAWFEFSNFEIQVSVHRLDHVLVINNKIKSILQCKKGWQVKQYAGYQEHKQIEWSLDGFRIYKSIFAEFVVPFKGDRTIESWNSDPCESHSICGSPDSPILYKGRLYKCPSIANIIDLTQQSYFDYNGFGPDDNLDEFVNEVGRPERVCGVCPDRSSARIINHLDIKNVKVRQKISN